MRKAMHMVQANLSREQARRAVLSLLAMGIRGEAKPEAGFGWAVSVPEADADGAADIIEEAIAPEPEPSADPPAYLVAPRVWTLANSRGSLAIAAVCIAVHLAVHEGAGPSARSAMIEAGAVAPWLVSEGQLWRLATAAFLHFDAKHLVGNMGSLFFLGPPLAASIGNARLLVLFLATAVAGNAVSQLLGSEAAVKAGASGGICGLLGALAGVALARMAATNDPRRRRPAWQTLGALVALFGMIVGVEPGSDHYAHVGGVVAGLLVGRALSPSEQEAA